MTERIIPTALSINTIALIWLAGNNSIYAWVLGVIGQVGWFVFIIVWEAWGLLPMAVALTYVYIRNLRKWHQSQNDKEVDKPFIPDRQGYPQPPPPAPKKAK